MSTPLIYRAVDLGEAFFARCMRKAKPKPAFERMTEEALATYEMLTGRQDVPDSIESRFLEVPEDQEEIVAELGAVKIDGVWTVPDELSTEQFELWWPRVPEDLRDRNPQGITTKHGDPLEAYLRASDNQRGDDSTATPIVYGLLVAVSVLAYFLGTLHPVLGLAALPLAIPLLIALTQGEGVTDAIRSAAILLLGPMALASGVQAFRSQLGLDKVGLFSAAKGLFAGDMATSGAMAVLTLSAISSAFVFMLIAIALWSVFDSKRKRATLGAGKGFWIVFKSNIKWAVLGTIGLAIALVVLPPPMFPFFIYAMASLYPMIHTEANFNDRAKELAAVGNKFRLARLGSMTKAHITPRLAQAKAAVEDKTPLLHIATATGFLTKKQYPFSPGEGQEMVFSALDSHSHLIVYGATGIGKTASVMRPLAYQWISSGAGGFLCLCGKGSLPSELSALIDLMVRPGMEFAPMQGLDAQGVATAINSIKVDSKKDEGNIWDGSAKDYMDHMTTFHEALRDHEHAYRMYATAMISDKEDTVDWWILELAKRQKRGGDVADAQANLDRARNQLTYWRQKEGVLVNRRWLWNIDTLARLSTTANQIVMRGGTYACCKEIEEALNFLGYNAEPERARNHPTTIHPEIGKGSMLDGTIDFLTREWPNTDEKQRSSVAFTLRARMNALTRGRLLVGRSGVHWKLLERGDDVSVCLYGKSVGVDLPDTLHGRAGLAITALVKQRIYDGVKGRSGKSEAEWMADGQTPLMVMIDEGHLVIGEPEANLATISRSLKLGFVVATQNWENLIDRFDGDENAAAKFENSFQSFICMETSEATYRRIRERLGTAELVKFEQESLGMDYKGGLRNFALSPLNDPEHPLRAGMEKLLQLGFGTPVVRFGTAFKDRMGLGWSGVRTMQLDENTMLEQMPMPVGGMREKAEIFEEHEYTSLLTKGQAIVFLRRGGVRRVDLATFKPVGPDAFRKPKEDVEVLEAETV